MTMTSIEASTAVLCHGDDAGSFLDKGPRRLTGTQAAGTAAGQSTTTVKFGALSIAPYTALTDYTGVKFSPVFYNTLMAFTLEAWVYVNVLRTPAPSSTGRRFFIALSDGSSIYASVSHTDAGVAQAYFDTSAGKNGINAGAMPVGQWAHVRLCRDDLGMYRFYLDGVYAGSLTSGFTSLVATNLSFYIGGIGTSTGYPADAFVDEARLLMGVSLNNDSSNFTPPTSAYADCPTLDGATKQAGAYKRTLSTFSSINYKRRSPSVNLKDIYFGGRGQIVGTVKEKHLPSNLPLHRRVCLRRQRDQMVVRETWSNATTGAYAFTNIDETLKYDVTTYDYLGNYRGVIADNLTPEIP